MTVWRAHSDSVTSLLCGERVRRVHEHHELVLAEHDRAEPRLGGLERQHAEIEAALRDFGADLARRDAAHVHVHQRVRLPEPGDERQHDVHRGFVGADEDAAAAQVAQVLDGALRLLRQAEQPLGVVAQQAPGVGQGGVLGGAVEQPLADALLEPADGLADRRLGPVQLHRGPREAPFGRNLQKYA